MMKKWFESAIWSSRLIVIVAVISSLLAAVALFYMSTVDAWHMVVHLLNYASPDLNTQQRMELRAETITHVVEMVDGFLLATVMLIFGMGLYELFISKIDQAQRSAVAMSAAHARALLMEMKNQLAPKRVHFSLCHSLSTSFP